MRENKKLSAVMWCEPFLHTHQHVGSRGQLLLVPKVLLLVGLPPWSKVADNFKTCWHVVILTGNLLFTFLKAALLFFRSKGYYPIKGEGNMHHVYHQMSNALLIEAGTTATYIYVVD